MPSRTTTQHNPKTAYVDPAAISMYINDLIVGMLETHNHQVTIRRGHRFPYFGCYSGSVIRVAFRQLANRLKAMTETMALGPQPETCRGFFMVIIGPDEQARQLRFDVEVGPDDSYLVLSLGA